MNGPENKIVKELVRM